MAGRPKPPEARLVVKGANYDSQLALEQDHVADRTRPWMESPTFLGYLAGTGLGHLLDQTMASSNARRDITA